MRIVALTFSFLLVSSLAVQASKEHLELSHFHYTGGDNPAAIPALRILLAEDTEISRVLIRSQVEKASKATSVPIDLTAANDGLPALKEFNSKKDIQGKKYHCLITDNHMPHMDGVALAERIRRTERGRKASFDLVLQTSDQKEQVQESYRKSSLPIDLSLLSELPSIPSIKGDSEKEDTESATEDILTAPPLFDAIYTKKDLGGLRDRIIALAEEYKKRKSI